MDKIFSYIVEKLNRCPRCKSESLVIVAMLPWSTDGLIPRRKLFLKCEDCGYIIDIGGGK